MSAYGCCGKYNEHDPKCITIKYERLLAENAKMKDALVQIARCIHDTESSEMDEIALDGQLEAMEMPDE